MEAKSNQKSRRGITRLCAFSRAYATHTSTMLNSNDFAFAHFANVMRCPLLGVKRTSFKQPSCPLLTQMYGPAVRSKKILTSWW